ncbi:MAG: cytochrome C oxidase subunit II [Gammaproteobacteria bacterium HGW-Gammaproteobacteria-8]|nr:MAG: cytochrome C oxidase subunit II [Gammaproteobacteria bacterium HGW-Gammaproteobacteria-8]
MLQSISLLLTLLLVIPIAVVFLLVAFSRPVATDAGALAARSYRLRDRSFWILLAVVTPVLLYTLTLMPYGADAEARDVQTVDVTGHMWYWKLSQNEFRAGEPVQFRVTSQDVNHGFGIYDEGLTLLAQTQAMPGYTNILEYTFQQPGAYRVMCLEYCGVAHHAMVAELTVTE